ncbi:carboxypeptidase regulatory-like domain-containing protein, partial [Candidatus Curtissbacteria bacterium]|nr:carboxypeptidase regulatory-like domain-containing protein [Candidatus Curtissbacteria bacterium]
IFFSPGPSIIRLPLTVLFGGLGLIAALVPIQGRPFDKWVVAFSRALLSPTQRVWVKEAKIPEFLNIVISQPKLSKTQPEPITSQDRQRLVAYLRSLPKAAVSPLDVKEEQALQKLGLAPAPLSLGLSAKARAAAGTLVSAGKLPPPILWTTAVPAKAAQKAPQISEEEFQGIMSQALPQITPTQTGARISPHAKAFALSGLGKKLSLRQITPAPKIQLASDTNFALENIIPIQTPGRKIRLVHGLAKTRTRKLHFAPPTGFNLSNLPVRGEARFAVSEELKKRFTTAEPSLPPLPETQNQAQPIHKEKPKIASGVPKTSSYVPRGQAGHLSPQNATLRVEQSESADSRISITGQKVAGGQPAAILQKAQIIPLTATPNVLSGLITDQGGAPLEAAIITVRDRNGIPVRALKTNKLGQFLSATPLSSGNYTLEIEHENAHFEPLALSLAGQIMQPLEIKAKGGN